MKRVYTKRDVFVTKEKKAKCGHFSKEARYFQCENCLPKLPEEDSDPDLIYYGDIGNEGERE